MINKDFRTACIRIVIIFIVLGMIFSLKNSEDFVETYYSHGIYPVIRGSFQFALNYIPVSVGDGLYIVVVALLAVAVYQLIRHLIRKNFKVAGLMLLRFFYMLGIAVAAFYLLWALNYFREPAKQRLRLANDEYDASELVKLTSMLIDSANLSRAALGPSDLEVSNKQVIRSAVMAIKGLSSFDPPLNPIKPAVKESLISPLLNYLGTAGYYNPFTGEGQFNSMMPVFTRPFVACHEMAHQMGFGAEDEANFAAFIAGISSKDKLLKYSSYYQAAQEFMTEVWRTDSVAFKEMKLRISSHVLRDLETERAYWISYQGSAARLSSIFYDSYLKVNKQPGGLKTYNRMIKLSAAYYRKKGIIQ